MPAALARRKFCNVGKRKAKGRFLPIWIKLLLYRKEGNNLELAKGVLLILFSVYIAVDGNSQQLARCDRFILISMEPPENRST
jgi:hypothetical protein